MRKKEGKEELTEFRFSFQLQTGLKTIHLPLKQFELAFELAKNPNQIFTREQLIEKIWGMDYDGFDRTVDVHIKRIRENLGHLPGFKVVTVRGLGYKIEVEP